MHNTRTDSSTINHGSAETKAAFGNAAVELARIVDRAPPMAGALRCDTRLTSAWGHGAVFDYLPAVTGHVIGTYYGEPREVLWRTGGERLQSRTLPGSITIIPQGHDGDWGIAGAIGVSHVFLTEERLKECAEQIVRGGRVDLIARVGFGDPTAARVMEMLGREANVTDRSSRLFLEQAMDLLCTQLARGHSSFGALVATAPQRGLAAWQVRKVTTYMREHLDESIGLDELAAEVELSRFHFCKVFQQATGLSPHEYLVQLRIEYARQLLADPKLTITDIALAVGYATPSSFAASFRRVSGITPTAYRRSL